jgi:hypothetical protein
MGSAESIAMYVVCFACGVIVCVLDVAYTTTPAGTLKQQQHSQSGLLALSTGGKRNFLVFLVV